MLTYQQTDQPTNINRRKHNLLVRGNALMLLTDIQQINALSNEAKHCSLSRRCQPDPLIIQHFIPTNI